MVLPKRKQNTPSHFHILAQKLYYGQSQVR